ncbi:DUF4013 domain-containing protein [Haloarcula salina]|uniref:DUF4013 domain-containing protein n=1 Tax=Haloarcula salina TaxID=1429914 RepID=A0AA41G2P0_9EURY|nr:DUF4013 domain-containing protein [Haloarcula salina]MBV0903238.1 DUF4013 domain-containing protein [Haloarcula salina]
MLEEAIRYPWSGEKNVETLLVGALLSALGVFFVPALLVYGYLISVIREVDAGNDESPPEFEEWTDLLVEGFVGFLIGVVYAVVPLAVLGLAVASLVLPVTVVSSPGGEPPASDIAIGGLLLALLVILVTVVIVVAAAYLLPAAIAAYAVTGRAGAAFSPGTLREIGGSRTYAVAWLVAVVIAVVAQAVAGVVAATVIGVLLLPVISFYGSVAGAYAIGTAAADVPALAGDRESASGGPTR